MKLRTVRSSAKTARKCIGLSLKKDPIAQCPPIYKASVRLARPISNVEDERVLSGHAFLYYRCRFRHIRSGGRFDHPRALAIYVLRSRAFGKRRTEASRVTYFLPRPRPVSHPGNKVVYECETPGTACLTVRLSSACAICACARKPAGNARRHSVAAWRTPGTGSSRRKATRSGKLAHRYFGCFPRSLPAEAYRGS